MRSKVKHSEVIRRCDEGRQWHTHTAFKDAEVIRDERRSKIITSQTVKVKPSHAMEAGHHRGIYRYVAVTITGEIGENCS